MEIAVIAVASLFFLGHALQWFFIKTKIPDLLILIGIGYLAGPVFGLISEAQLGGAGKFLSTLALIVILYEGGLHLSARDLLTSSLPALGISTLGFVLIVAMTTFVCLSFMPWEQSLLLGLAMGSTSSAIVIPLVKPLTIKENTKTILSLESAFTDVLAIVLFLVVIEALKKGQFDWAPIMYGLGPSTLISATFGFGFALIWAWAKKHQSHLTSMTFAGEAFALLCYGVIEVLHYNGAMGVLALGFTLANLNLLPKFVLPLLSQVPVSYTELSLLKEITFLLKTFFFLYLGTLISFQDWKLALVALLLVILIAVSRFITVRLLFSSKKYNLQEVVVLTFMGPRGLACAVLATIPVSQGIQRGHDIQQILFAVIPISILMTAICVAFSEKPHSLKWFQSLFSSYKGET